MRTLARQILLGASIAWFFGGPAHAQAPLDGLLNVPASDLSLQLLGRVFGEAPLGLWAAVGQDSPLGAMFASLMGVLLSMAVFWFGYNVVAAITATAEDGSFMGKRFSTVWLPIRFVVGISMLVPMFPVPGGAWSGAQVGMAWASKIGIGAANVLARMGTNVMTTYNSTGVSVVGGHRDLAEALYRSNLCMEALNRGALNAQASGVTLFAAAQPVVVSSINTPLERGFRFERAGLFNDVFSNTCGRVVVKFPNPAQIQSGGAFAVFNAANRLQTIREQTDILRDHIRTGLGQLNQQANELARQTVQSFSTDGATAASSAQIDQIATNYTQSLASATNGIATALAGPMAAAVQTEVTEKGWVVLGAWYQSISQLNAEVQKVVNGPAAVDAPQLPEASGEYAALYRDVLSAHNRTAAGGGSAATGDANAILELVFTGVGGPSTAAVATWMGQGAFDQNSNPIVAMKNFGDYLTGIAATALVAATILRGTVDAVDGGAAGVVQRFLPINVSGGIASALEFLSPALILAITMLFFFGVTLAVYIPMLPFLVWMGGIIGWLSVQAEALIAAPLGALAHMETEGEGLGQRTQHAYLFLTNVLLRPALMVLGFFVASGMVVALGWLINSLFAPAVANAQFNSWTGIVQFFGFLFVYWGLALTVVTASFQLIQIVPDQVLGWLGGNVNTRLGADTEERTSRIFAAALMRSQALPGSGGGKSGQQNQPGNARQRARLDRGISVDQSRPQG